MSTSLNRVFYTLFLLSICLIASCGKSSRSADTRGNVSAKTGTIFDSCTLVGNMEDFEVSCTKEIKTIQMGAYIVGNGLNKTEDGKQTNIQKINSTTLEGSASGHGKILVFQINHTDGSSSTIRVS